MVLVARDQLLDRLPVDLPRGVVDRLLGERHVPLRAEDAAGQAHVQPHGRGLVDHHDAVAVGVVEHLLGVGVVRRAERVRAQPLQQREVVDHERVVVRLAAHRGVLVLAEPLEVERLAVDQKARAVDLHGADADRQRVGVDRRVAVAPQLDAELVQVALAGAPGVDAGDRQLALGAGRPGDLGPVRVAQDGADVRARRRRRGSARTPSAPSRSVTTVTSLMCVRGVVYSHTGRWMPA